MRTVHRIRPRESSWGLACLPAAILLFLAAVVDGRLPSTLFVMPIVLSGLLLAVAMRHFFPERALGVLEVNPAALSWQGSALCPRDDLEEAIAFSNEERHGVRLRLHRRYFRRSVYFETSTRADADALVQELGLGAGKSTIEACYEVPLLAFVGFAIPLIGAQALVLPVVVIAFVLARLFERRATIGSDGIRIGNRWKHRFMPYRDITSVAVRTWGRLSLRAREGDVTLSLGDDSKKHRLPGVGANAYAARIMEEMAVCRSRVAAEDHVTGLLLRGDRTTRAWTQALGSMGEGAPGFRQAAVSRESLWQVLEDGAQPAEARAAAAMVLRRGQSDQDRPRLRIAAATSADPRLRVSLEAASSADEDALVQSLGALVDKKKTAANP